MAYTLTTFKSQKSVKIRVSVLVKTSQEMSDEIEEGKVIRQLPSAGHVLETGDSIRLFVSSGPNKFELDSYVGSELADAKEALELQGVEVTSAEEYSKSEVEYLTKKFEWFQPDDL